MNLGDYFRETKDELRHVSWPSRKEGTNFTVLVVVISVVVGILLGFFDLIFAKLLKFLTTLL